MKVSDKQWWSPLSKWKTQKNSNKNRVSDKRFGRMAAPRPILVIKSRVWVGSREPAEIAKRGHKYAAHNSPCMVLEKATRYTMYY
jgi:hypothetical protein